MTGCEFRDAPSNRSKLLLRRGTKTELATWPGAGFGLKTQVVRGAVKTCRATDVRPTQGAPDRGESIAFHSASSPLAFRGRRTDVSTRSAFHPKQAASRRASGRFADGSVVGEGDVNSTLLYKKRATGRGCNREVSGAPRHESARPSITSQPCGGGRWFLGALWAGGTRGTPVPP
jgi:hypothetical protein